jgi:hypothetical protein
MSEPALKIVDRNSEGINSQEKVDKRELLINS